MVNKDFINENWNELKCSPLGPFLQMIGIAPGDAKNTSDSCKSSEFSSQFNSSMSEHINITSKDIYLDRVVTTKANMSLADLIHEKLRAEGIMRMML